MIVCYCPVELTATTNSNTRVQDMMGRIKRIAKQVHPNVMSQSVQVLDFIAQSLEFSQLH